MMSDFEKCYESINIFCDGSITIDVDWVNQTIDIHKPKDDTEELEKQINELKEEVNRYKEALGTVSQKNEDLRETIECYKDALQRAKEKDGD